MRLIGLWMTAVLLIAPGDTPAGEGARSWYLLEPPVDETSNVVFGIWGTRPSTNGSALRRMTLRPRVSTNETKRSKPAGRKHCVCRRHRRSQSWRYSEEPTAIVASQTPVSASLPMTLD
jgi:hypothetical protein